MENQLSQELTESVISARPFLKWAGSKHALLNHILPLIPKQYGKYYEPFIGAGSLFLNLQPRSAQISDLSSELVEVWRALKLNPEGLIKLLIDQRPDETTFYKIRSNRSSEYLKRASEFIYLNKSCYNGLYRVNKKGEFNVPFGANAGAAIIDPDNIRRCAKILSPPDVSILQCDFSVATKNVVKGDLVFFDPPYVTKHNFNGFRDYNEKLFSWADQERLATEARRLISIGAHVIVTNAAHSDIKSLYQDFEAYEFERSSTLASKSIARGKVAEVIYYG